MTDVRAISKLVLDHGFTVAGALKAVEPGAIDIAIAELENPVPIIKQDPKLTGEVANRLGDLLRPIGAKVAPQLNNEQALAWRAAMILALSDLTPSIALYAVRKAVHVPCDHLSRVDGAIRDIAKDAMEKQRIAVARLKAMKRELDRATNGQKRLTAEPETWTQEEVDKANAIFRRTGVKTRYELDGTSVRTIQPTPDDREEERQRNLREQP